MSSYISLSWIFLLSSLSLPKLPYDQFGSLQLHLVSNIFNLFLIEGLLVHFFYFKIESTNTKYSAVKEKNKKTIMTDNCRMTSLNSTNLNPFELPSFISLGSFYPTLFPEPSLITSNLHKVFFTLIVLSSSQENSNTFLPSNS